MFDNGSKQIGLNWIELDQPESNRETKVIHSSGSSFKLNYKLLFFNSILFFFIYLSNEKQNILRKKRQNRFSIVYNYFIYWNKCFSCTSLMIFKNTEREQECSEMVTFICAIPQTPFLLNIEHLLFVLQEDWIEKKERKKMKKQTKRCTWSSMGKAQIISVPRIGDMY